MATETSKRSDRDLLINTSLFTIKFTNIVRCETTKRHARYHDDREEFPAYMWHGDVTITSKDHDKTVSMKFTTDTFFVGHVENLFFNDILLLALIEGKLWRSVLKNEEGKFFYNHLARKLLLKYFFEGSGRSINIEPFRPGESGEDELLGHGRMFISYDPVPEVVLP